MQCLVVGDSKAMTGNLHLALVLGIAQELRGDTGAETTTAKHHKMSPQNSHQAACTRPPTSLRTWTGGGRTDGGGVGGGGGRTGREEDAQFVHCCISAYNNE